MNAIIEYQRKFFEDGEENDLKPMILKDIAEIIKMDISTVSRIVSSKVVQTDFGVFPLKYFFSESTIMKGKNYVSSKVVKNFLIICSRIILKKRILFIVKIKKDHSLMNC